MIADEKSDPSVIPGIYERDEEEQVRHLRDMLAIYEAEGIDSAFWFTLAGYESPRDRTDPHRDLDVASYGVVAVLEHERGTAYPDMAWEPKRVFGALAAAYAAPDARLRRLPESCVERRGEQRQGNSPSPMPNGVLS